MQVDEKSICRLDKLPYVWGAIFGYTERKKYDRMNKHLHAMKKALYMLAAAAVMGATSCGGKEDAEPNYMKNEESVMAYISLKPGAIWLCDENKNFANKIYYIWFRTTLYYESCEIECAYCSGTYDDEGDCKYKTKTYNYNIINVNGKYLINRDNYSGDSSFITKCVYPELQIEGGDLSGVYIFQP
jgi:hypothetical protein